MQSLKLQEFFFATCLLVPLKVITEIVNKSCNLLGNLNEKSVRKQMKTCPSRQKYSPHCMLILSKGCLFFSPFRKARERTGCCVIDCKEKESEKYSFDKKRLRLIVVER